MENAHSIGACIYTVITCLAVLMVLPLRASGPDAAAFRVDEVAPKVFVHPGTHAGLDHTGRGDSANIGFIVGERCIAVIDSGGSVRTGQQLLTAIRAHSAKPICYVINTHVHFDHVLGNAAFADTGATFVGHAELAPALAASRTFFLERFAAELSTAPPGQELVLPSKMIEDEALLDLGGRQLRLTAQPRSHSSSDLTVLDERTGTLWTGDLLFIERLPVVDGSVRGWLAVLRTLEQVPAKRVVPGHGPSSVAWPQASRGQSDYLEALLITARHAVAAGQFLEDFEAQAAAHVPPGWVVAEPHARNASRAYREVEWE